MQEEYPIESLVQHRRGMLLIDRLLSHAENSVETEVTIRPDSTFCVDGKVPAWVGLEYAAQGVAVYAGLQEKKLGLPAKVGFLLGCRNYETHVPHFPVGMVLRIHVAEEFRDHNMGVYQCSLYDQENNMVATTSLRAYVPDNLDDILL